MKKGDFLNAQLTDKIINGKKVKVGIIVDNNNVKYEVVKQKFAFGGFASMHHATRLSDGTKFVFKEFKSGKNDRNMQKALPLIKNNIQDLIDRPLMESGGAISLKGFVPPISIAELRASNKFGYFMELIDTKKYINSIIDLHSKECAPDAKVLCQIVKNICHVFSAIHYSGKAYKDVNEGNIYIDYKTGEILIADADNICGKSNVNTVAGTPGFMAPEIYLGKQPDRSTDYFSLATYFYRLMVGGYPLEGKATFKYGQLTDKLNNDDNNLLFGTHALFAFDPVDNHNSISDLTDDEECRIQTICWNQLPQPVKDLFIKTFSTGLKYDKRNLRARPEEWVKVFDDLEKNHLVQCSCGKYVFDNLKACKHCGRKFSNGSKLNTATTSSNAPQITYKARLNRRVSATIRLVEGVHDTSFIDKSFKCPFAQVKFDPASRCYTIKNITNANWAVSIHFFDQNTKPVKVNAGGKMVDKTTQSLAPGAKMKMLLKHPDNSIRIVYAIQFSVNNNLVEIAIN